MLTLWREYVRMARGICILKHKVMHRRHRRCLHDIIKFFTNYERLLEPIGNAFQYVFTVHVHINGDIDHHILGLVRVSSRGNSMRAEIQNVVFLPYTTNIVSYCCGCIVSSLSQVFGTISCAAYFQLFFCCVYLFSDIAIFTYHTYQRKGSENDHQLIDAIIASVCLFCDLIITGGVRELVCMNLYQKFPSQRHTRDEIIKSGNVHYFSKIVKKSRLLLAKTLVAIPLVAYFVLLRLAHPTDNYQFIIDFCGYGLLLSFFSFDIPFMNSFRDVDTVTLEGIFIIELSSEKVRGYEAQYQVATTVRAILSVLFALLFVLVFISNVSDVNKGSLEVAASFVGKICLMPNIMVIHLLYCREYCLVFHGAFGH